MNSLPFLIRPKRLVIWAGWVVALMILGLRPAYGVEPLQDLELARRLADRAMSLFAEQSSAAGYTSLKPHWPLPDEEFENLVKTTDNNRQLTTSRIGNYVDFEFIKMQKIGDSVVRFVYLQKFELSALQWVFIFYRATDTWTVAAVYHSFDVNQLFENR